MTEKTKVLITDDRESLFQVAVKLVPSSAESGRAALKAWLDIVQAIFTIGAIVAAGYWFIEQQSLKPQIKIEQAVSQRALAGKPGFWLIAIDVKATNIGKVKVHLNDGMMFLKQINPVPGEDLAKVKLRDIVLDPGEADQALFTTFEIPDYIHTIQIASSYGVPGAKGYSWELMSAADIGDGKPEKTVMSSGP